MAFDALVFGPMFCDLVFTGMKKMPALGEEIFAEDLTIAPGGSAIAAIGMQRLGVRVGLAADLGSDVFSGILWELLQTYELDRSLIRRLPQPLPQVTVAISFPEDRAFLTRFAAAGDPLDTQTLLQESGARHLHVGSFLPLFQCPEIVQNAHAAGMTVSLDPGWDEEGLRDPRLQQAVRDLDFFLPSRSELCFFAGEQDPDSAAIKVAGMMDHGALIVKCGALGARAYLQPDGTRIQTAALDVEVVDTTGAGDAFDAGFLAACLEGLPIEESMRWGTTCGSLAATGIGGPGSLPHREELFQWL